MADYEEWFRRGSTVGSGSSIDLERKSHRRGSRTIHSRHPGMRRIVIIFAVARVRPLKSPRVCRFLIGHGNLSGLRGCKYRRPGRLVSAGELIMLPSLTEHTFRAVWTPRFQVTGGNLLGRSFFGRRARV
jgi:hypothetical protein